MRRSLRKTQVLGTCAKGLGQNHPSVTRAPRVIDPQPQGSPGKAIRVGGRGGLQVQSQLMSKSLSLPGRPEPTSSVCLGSAGFVAT